MRLEEKAPYLRNEPIQIGVRRAVDVQIAAANVVQRLVVEQEGHIRVLHRRMARQHRVVRLDHAGGNLSKNQKRKYIIMRRVHFTM